MPLTLAYIPVRQTVHACRHTHTHSVTRAATERRTQHHDDTRGGMHRGVPCSSASLTSASHTHTRTHTHIHTQAHTHTHTLHNFGKGKRSAEQKKKGGAGCNIGTGAFLSCWLSGPSFLQVRFHPTSPGLRWPGQVTVVPGPLQSCVLNG